MGLYQSGLPLLPPGAMVTSRPRLLPRTMRGSVVLLQSRSRFMFVAHVLPKVTRSLGSGLQSVALMVSWDHVAARAFLISVAGATTWSKDVNQTEQLPGVMSRSMAKLQPGSILKSLTQVATRPHTEP